MPWPAPHSHRTVTCRPPACEVRSAAGSTRGASILVPPKRLPPAFGATSCYDPSSQQAWSTESPSARPASCPCPTDQRSTPLRQHPSRH